MTCTVYEQQCRLVFDQSVCRERLWFSDCESIDLRGSQCVSASFIRCRGIRIDAQCTFTTPDEILLQFHDCSDVTVFGDRAPDAPFWVVKASPPPPPPPPPPAPSPILQLHLEPAEPPGKK